MSSRPSTPFRDVSICAHVPAHAVRHGGLLDWVVTHGHIIGTLFDLSGRTRGVERYVGWRHSRGHVRRHAAGQQRLGPREADCGCSRGRDLGHGLSGPGVPGAMLIVPQKQQIIISRTVARASCGGSLPRSKHVHGMYSPLSTTPVTASQAAACARDRGMHFAASLTQQMAATSLQLPARRVMGLTRVS